MQFHATIQTINQVSLDYIIILTTGLPAVSIMESIEKGKPSEGQGTPLFKMPWDMNVLLTSLLFPAQTSQALSGHILLARG